MTSAVEPSPGSNEPSPGSQERSISRKQSAGSHQQPTGSEGVQAVRSPAWDARVALLVVVALALFWMPALSSARSMGWDESMHAALPAARMRLALGAGEVRAAADALLGCSQYPFVYPLVLALAPSSHFSEFACRLTGTFLWCAALFGLFLCGRECARRLSWKRAPPAHALRLLPWFALGLGALSPLALAYSGTLFLEVPFTCAAIFALWAWMRRDAVAPEVRDDAGRWSRRRELAAGALITVCFFTKFNYGLLLVAGLALDWLVQGVLALRARRAAEFGQRSAWLCVLPAVCALWWFCLPLPGGLELAREHRAALLEFLAGNRELTPTPYALRLLHAAGALTFEPRLFVVELVALCATLTLVKQPVVRTLWCVLLALCVPVLAHPFHLDRFLIPCAIGLWMLSAIGLARLVPRNPRMSLVACALLALFVAVLPGRDTLWLAQKLGYVSAEPNVRAYQQSVFASWRALGDTRSFPTAGLERAEHDALLALVAREAAPLERIGWLGVSSELSPAALHLGLYELGGTRERFLRDASRPIDVTYFGSDPAWDAGRLREFASGFDVIFFTEPLDLKTRAGRAFIGAYRDRLTSELGWQVRELGQVAIARPLKEPLVVTLKACRKQP